MKNLIITILASTILLSQISNAEGIFNYTIPQPNLITDDWDGDGDPNATDPDDDGDGINDENDSNPFDRRNGGGSGISIGSSGADKIDKIAMILDPTGGSRAELVGVGSNGELLRAGNSQTNVDNIENWENIVEVGQLYYMLYGLTSSGSIVLASNNSSASFGISTTRTDHLAALSWNNIKDINSNNYEHIFGLTTENTLVFSGPNSSKYNPITSWENITFFETSIHGNNTSGDVYAVNSDGLVLTTSTNSSILSIVQNINDNNLKVVDIEANVANVAFLLDDNTVLSSYSDINNLNNVKMVRAEGNGFFIAYNDNSHNLYLSYDPDINSLPNGIIDYYTKSGNNTYRIAVYENEIKHTEKFYSTVSDHIPAEIDTWNLK